MTNDLLEGLYLEHIFNDANDKTNYSSYMEQRAKEIVAYMSGWKLKNVNRFNAEMWKGDIGISIDYQATTGLKGLVCWDYNCFEIRGIKDNNQRNVLCNTTYITAPAYYTSERIANSILRYIPSYLKEKEEWLNLSKKNIVKYKFIISAQNGKGEWSERAISVYAPEDDKIEAVRKACAVNNDMFPDKNGYCDWKWKEIKE